MSDDQPPPSPYGQPGGSTPPSPPVNPYGQSQQPPAYGQAQPPAYGQPAAPAYGQYSQYGTPAAYGAPHDPDKRPGSVTAGAVIALVTSAITLLLFVLTIVGLAFARDDFIDSLRDEPGLEDFTGTDLFNVILGVTIVLAVWSLLAIVLSVLALRRSNAARIMLVISSALSATVSLLLGFVLFLPFLNFAAGVATIVLLFVGGAGDWYSRRGASAPSGGSSLPPGTTQPWG